MDRMNNLPVRVFFTVRGYADVEAEAKWFRHPRSEESGGG
jgi:hypothetical protein